MDKETKDALAEIDARLEKIEATSAAYLADHTAWLVALQAISAVTTVRQISGAAAPADVLEASRKWSSDIVSSTTPAATIPAETAETIRVMAHEKLDAYFSGISISE